MFSSINYTLINQQWKSNRSRGRKCGEVGWVVHPYTYVSVGLKMSSVGLKIYIVMRRLH